MAHRGLSLSRILRRRPYVQIVSVRRVSGKSWDQYKRRQSWSVTLRQLSSTSGADAALPEQAEPPSSTRLVRTVTKSIVDECGGDGGDLITSLAARGWNSEVLNLVASAEGASNHEKLQNGLRRVWTESAQVESLVELFGKSVELHKHRGMLGYWIMDTLYPLGQWKDITFYQFSILVDDVRAMLSANGVKAGDKVSVLGRNSIEGVATAFATWGLKAVLVPLYEEQREDEWIQILNDSQAKLVLAGTKPLYDKIDARKAELTHLDPANLICVDGVDGYMRWDDFGFTNQLKNVRGDVLGKPKTRMQVPVTPAVLEDTAMLCYTAGGGAVAPHSVALSHGNILANVLARELVQPLHQKDVSMSLLPWANPSGLAFELLGMMRSGGLVNICEGRGRLRRDVMESKPTILFITPPTLTVLKRQLDRDCEEKVYGWAWRLALQTLRKQRAGDDSLVTSLLNRFLSRFVLWRVRPLLGGKLAHIVFAGSRPSEEDREFFEILGIRTTEMYHVTGAAGPVGFFACQEAGTTEPDGTPVPSMNVRVVDGTVLISGPSVRAPPMLQVHACESGERSILTRWQVAPKSEGDKDGWGSAETTTGDEGIQGENGRIRLTGRVGHRFRLACGTQVSPTQMEDAFIRQTLIHQAVVCGDGKAGSIALIVPDFEKLQTEQGKRLGHAREQTESQLLDDPRLRSMVNAQAEQVMAALKASPLLSQEVKEKGIPRNFVLLDRAFSIEDGTLAPTGAVRRRVVLERHSACIDGFP